MTRRGEKSFMTAEININDSLLASAEAALTLLPMPATGCPCRPSHTGAGNGTGRGVDTLAGDAIQTGAV